jgi:hypothetical protein
VAVPAPRLARFRSPRDDTQLGTKRISRLLMGRYLIIWHAPG